MFFKVIRVFLGFPPRKKGGSVLGMIYKTYMLLLMNVTFVIVQNSLSLKPYEFASNFLDRNIQVSIKGLHCSNFLVKLCSQLFQVSQKVIFYNVFFFNIYMLQFGLTRYKHSVILRSRTDN